MPRKRRMPKAKRQYTVNLDVLNAACDRTSWEHHWGGPNAGREAWEALRDKLSTNLGTRPAPFWAYDAPKQFRPLAHVDVANPALEIRAWRWMLGPGKRYLRDGEGPAVLERLDHLADEAEAVQR